MGGLAWVARGPPCHTTARTLAAWVTTAPSLESLSSALARKPVPALARALSPPRPFRIDQKLPRQGAGARAQVAPAAQRRALQEGPGGRRQAHRAPEAVLQPQRAALRRLLRVDRDAAHARRAAPLLQAPSDDASARQVQGLAFRRRHGPGRPRRSARATTSSSGRSTASRSG